MSKIDKLETAEEKLTMEELKMAIGSRSGIKLEPLHKAMNRALSVVDEEDVEIISEGMLSQWSVLESGKYKYEDYANAVTYVSYKRMGYTNIDAYKRTFPHRYERLRQKSIEKGLLSEEAIRNAISPNVAGYNTNTIVNKVMELALIPPSIMNAPIFQKATLAQAAMLDDDSISPAVRQKAADSLMTHLKPAETNKIEIDLGVRQTSEVSMLRETIRALAAGQKQQIEDKSMTPKEVAEMQIIDVTDEEEEA